MQHRFLLHALGLAVLGTLSVSSASMAGSRGNSHQLAAAACTLSQLKISATWAQTNTNLPGGGAVQGQVSFRNAAKEDCTLAGFLKIQLVDGSGATLAVPDKHKGQVSTTVTLKANRANRATAGFNWLNWCKGAVTAPIQIRITLPNKSGHLQLANKNKASTGAKAASCVNPTSGSVVDVDPFLIV